MRRVVFIVVAACSSPVSPATISSSIAEAPTSTSTEPVAAEVPVPIQLGRAGWFDVVDDTRHFEATMIAADRCIAVRDGVRVLIRPDKSVPNATPTICDGQTISILSMPEPFDRLYPIGERIVYEQNAQLWLAQSVDMVPSKLETPFASHPDASAADLRIEVAGASLLVNDRKDPKGVLHRFDGSEWSAPKLDGSKVTSFVGTPDGLAFAITSQRGVYQSSDSGASWSKRQHTLIEPRHLEVSSLDRPQRMVRLVGKASSSPGQPPADAFLEVAGPVEDLRFPYAAVAVPPPEGVSNVRGAPLEDEYAARERMLQDRKCTQFRIWQSYATATCEDREGMVVLWSDDLGVTVREIYRQAHVRTEILSLNEKEVLIVVSCQQGSSECADKNGVLLTRSDGAWRTRLMPLPVFSEYAQVVSNRSGKGGFYIPDEQVTWKEGVPFDYLAILHLNDGALTRHPISLSFIGEPSAAVGPLRVSSAVVNDDGNLALLLVAGGRARPEDQRVAYLELSPEMKPLDARLLHAADGGPLIDRLERSFLAGRKIILFNAAKLTLRVSPDAGRTFESFGLPQLTQVSSIRSQRPNVVCGAAGCDFSWHGVHYTRAWRWGAEPFSATLSGSQSR